jgi:DNA ligase-1
MVKHKAMLAHKFDKSRVDWNEAVYIQPKLDGVRCLFTKDGAYSRNHKQFMNVRHIRKQKPTDTDRRDAQHLVQFHCYDYVDGKYESYKKRRFNLVVSGIYDTQVKYVPTKLVDSYNYARELHQQFLDKGYEGSIIRLDGLYKHGRSYDLMKFKDFSDTEATIVGYEIGKGKRSGTLGKFLMLDDDGVKFGCPPGKGYTYKDLANMLVNIDDYIGKRATFTYFQRTQAGSYRHPLFKAIRNYE